MVLTLGSLEIIDIARAPDLGTDTIEKHSDHLLLRLSNNF